MHRDYARNMLFIENTQREKEKERERERGRGERTLFIKRY